MASQFNVIAKKKKKPSIATFKDIAVRRSREQGIATIFYSET